MAQEMREEDLRNSLAYFTDSRDGKDVRGFGIDLGPGLPKNTRLIWHGLDFNGLVRKEILLLDENNPLMTFRKLSFADFLVCARSIFELARKHHILAYGIANYHFFCIPDLQAGIPFSEIDFNKNADTIAEQRLPIFPSIDWLNAIIAELIQEGITDF